MYVPEIMRLDLARDAHHYDVITATNFVDQVENFEMLKKVEIR
jgi:hypothetical protein